MSFARPLSLLALAASLAAGGAARADEPVKVTLTLKDHVFSPAAPTAPAGKPLLIEIVNTDGTAAEFESKPLRLEKVVAAGKTVTLKVPPQKPGRYRFFDDYNEETAAGVLVVE